MKTLYDPDTHPDQVAAYAHEGMINEEIAQKLGIHVSTLYDWQNVHPEFAEAIKKGKKVASAEVARAMYKKAVGYDYEEVTIYGKMGADGKMVGKEIKTQKKHMPPDVAAGMCLLTNWDPAHYKHRQTVKIEPVGRGEFGDLEDLTDGELRDIIEGREIGSLENGEGETGSSEEAPGRLSPGGNGKPLEAGKTFSGPV